MSHVDEPRIIDNGRVQRVAHVRTCDTCKGVGHVLMCQHGTVCNCAGEPVQCFLCDGTGEEKDFDCDCPDCRAMTVQLGQPVGPDIDGWECGDCGARFVSSVAAANHAWDHDHETYGVFAETGNHHVH